jgi:hypothetical protein
LVGAVSAAIRQDWRAHEIDLLPGNDHGFATNWGGFCAQIARARIGDFLQRYAVAAQFL